MNSDSSSALAGLFILGIVFFVWFLPILSIMLSSRMSKSEKTSMDFSSTFCIVVRLDFLLTACSN